MLRMPLPPDELPAGQVRLQVGDVSIVVDCALGGRAVSWCVGGHELLHGYGDDPVEHGMYPMAPWAGRVRDNSVLGPQGPQPLPVTYGAWALHGTVLDQHVDVTHVIHASDRAEVRTVVSTGSSWPWPGRIETSWLLEPRRLTTRLALVVERDRVPGVLGWHPWFRRRVGNADGMWAMNADAMLLRGDGALPSLLTEVPEAGPFDDAFRVPDGRATIQWPGVIALDIVSDGSWFVVFDERPEAICIEPQSGPPDGLADRPWHDVAYARPGDPLVLMTTWAMRDLPEGR